MGYTTNNDKNRRITMSEDKGPEITFLKLTEDDVKWASELTDFSLENMIKSYGKQKGVTDDN